MPVEVVILKRYVKIKTYVRICTEEVEIMLFYYVDRYDFSA